MALGLMLWTLLGWSLADNVLLLAIFFVVRASRRALRAKQKKKPMHAHPGLTLAFFGLTFLHTDAALIFDQVAIPVGTLDCLKTSGHSKGPIAAANASRSARCYCVVSPCTRSSMFSDSSVFSSSPTSLFCDSSLLFLDMLAVASSTEPFTLAIA